MCLSDVRLAKIKSRVFTNSTTALLNMALQTSIDCRLRSADLMKGMADGEVWKQWEKES